jgi:predicted glycosyltransferase
VCPRRRSTRCTSWFHYLVGGVAAAYGQVDAETQVGIESTIRSLRQLRACRAGLTTCMELTANQRPFLYFPLRHHFEQNFHVRHRLWRYGAGRALDFEVATPETIAEAIADEIGRPVDYRPVERDGAARAAALIAELL